MEVVHSHVEGSAGGISFFWRKNELAVSNVVRNKRSSFSPLSYDLGANFGEGEVAMGLPWICEDAIGRMEGVVAGI